MSLIKIPSDVHPSRDSCRHVVSSLSVLLDNASFWFVFFGFAFSAIRGGFLCLPEVFGSADAKKVRAWESSLGVTSPCVSTKWHAQEMTAGMSCLCFPCAVLLWFMGSAVSMWQSCLQSTAESNILAGYFKMLDTFIATGMWSCNCCDKSAVVYGVENLILPSKYSAARLG